MSGFFDDMIPLFFFVAAIVTFIALALGSTFILEQNFFDFKVVDKCIGEDGNYYVEDAHGEWWEIDRGNVYDYMQIGSIYRGTYKNTWGREYTRMIYSVERKPHCVDTNATCTTCGDNS